MVGWQYLGWRAHTVGTVISRNSSYRAYNDRFERSEVKSRVNMVGVISGTK
jgi:hypothetical protein